MTVLLRYPDGQGMFGIKRYSLELAEGLRHEGVRVRLQRSWAQELRLGRLRVGGLLTRKLAPYVPALGADVVHATAIHVAPRVGRLDVATIHDVMPSVRPDLYGLDAAGKEEADAAVRHALRARHVIVDSAHTQRCLQRAFGVPPERVSVVHLGVTEGFRPDPLPADSPLRKLLQPDRLNVVCAMNAELRKRADLLLEAVRDMPEVNVIHVGNPTPPAGQDAIRALVAQPAEALRKEGRYAHVARASDAELRGLFSSADLVVHPSVDEGFGLPPLEALACGARVIASRIPPHEEVLGDAVRYADLDAASIRRAIAQASEGGRVREDAFAPREARLAHARAFTWQRTARETLAVYRRLRPGKSL